MRKSACPSTCCPVCLGWGGHSSPGCSVPYGDTYVSLPDDWDECPNCIGEGRCPWCGEPIRDTSTPNAHYTLECTSDDCSWNDSKPGAEPDIEPDFWWENQ